MRIEHCLCIMLVCAGQVPITTDNGELTVFIPKDFLKMARSLWHL